MFTRDGGSTYIYSAAISTLLNHWIHVVITSTSSGITNFYADGVLIGSANQSAGTPGNANRYRIGETFGDSYCVNGVIEGFKISKGIWSAEQIALAASVYED
jgi:hypothetical protein